MGTALISEPTDIADPANLCPGIAAAVAGWTIREAAEDLSIATGDMVWGDGGFLSIFRDTRQNSVTLRFGAILDAQVCLDRRTIDWRPGELEDGAAALHLLANQVLPRAIAHEGEFILHAALLEKNDKGFLLMGETGRGKSTLAASLLASGFALAGDDCVLIGPIDPAPVATAVSPSLRLLPDSRHFLFPDETAAVPVARYTSKYALPDCAGSTGESQKFDAIFLLAPPAADDAITSVRLGVGEAAMAILENSGALDPTDRHHASLLFAQACDLAERVPVYALNYRREFALLAQVHDAIAETLALQSADLR